MPIYEYQCGTCETSIEFIEKMKDRKTKKCPNCGTMTLEPVISGDQQYILKGPGFYKPGVN